MNALQVTTIARDVLALLLAACCPGCDLPGTLLCEPCRAQLAPHPLTMTTGQGLVVHAALDYQGVAARCIRRVKEEGATLLARPLGAALADVIAAHAPAGALLVPVPTSRAAYRRRGYRVPELLVRRAGRVCRRLLRQSRRTADQRGLGRASRARNVADSMRALGRGEGRPVVIIDDVVTTGATLDEAARALRDAGFKPLCAITLAATPGRANRSELIVTR